VLERAAELTSAIIERIEAALFIDADAPSIDDAPGANAPRAA
jgi:hypothetical protein